MTRIQDPEPLPFFGSEKEKRDIKMYESKDSIHKFHSWRLPSSVNFRSRAERRFSAMFAKYFDAKGIKNDFIAIFFWSLLQIELLVVYGADPGAMDVNGKSPVEMARDAGHADLAERLVEMAFELTGKN